MDIINIDHHRHDSPISHGYHVITNAHQIPPMLVQDTGYTP